MPVEFSDEALTSAQAGVKRMLNAKRTVVNENLDITQTAEYKAFVDAMDDDLNTSKALAVLFELANKANKDEMIHILHVIRTVYITSVHLVMYIFLSVFPFFIKLFPFNIIS